MKDKINKVIQIIVFISLFYFCTLPILSVIIYGLAGKSALYNRAMFSRVFRLLGNSLVLSITVTVISVLLGITVTFTLYRIKLRSRKLLRVLMLLPIINPAFIGSISFIMLFGKQGLITHKLLGLNVSPYGWQGVLILQVLSLTTLSYILISSSIQKIDTTLEYAARNLGASEKEVLFSVTLPMMVPEITAAALLVFLSSMADFTTPLIIGGKFRTLASDLYVQITGVYNMKSAALSGIILLIPCTIAFLLQRYFSKRKSYFTDQSCRDSNIEYEKVSPLVKAALIFVTFAVISISVVNFVFIIIGVFTKNWGYDYAFTLKNLKEAMNYNLKPYFNSVKLSVIVAFLSSLIGVLLAYFINRKKIILPYWIDFMGVFPAAVPGILFGIGYLVTFKYPLFGFTHLVLLGTGVIIYFICISRSLNVSMKSGYALLEHMDPDLENASYNLGAGRIQTFFYIIIPQLKDAFSAAYIKTFSSTMTTLGAIIFLLLPENKVAVQVIFQAITGSPIGVSSTLALMLSMLNLLLMGVFYLIIYKKELKDKFRRIDNEN